MPDPKAPSVALLEEQRRLNPDLAAIYRHLLGIREDLAVITMAILSERVIAAGVPLEDVPVRTAKLYSTYLHNVHTIRERPEPPTGGRGPAGP